MLLKDAAREAKEAAIAGQTRLGEQPWLAINESKDMAKVYI